ncbi:MULTISPECIES: hypothetical protein [Rhodopseudomonas]|uniref:Uncharacterized protein n=1 Tax=Rhodopseudomonas palustris TaxID=1076 RepID=A0A0D7EKD6_RHOPL|nr:MULTISPECIES: hypothetical protein [Rhodopseudomonas]KIZ41289.1 hypothetical protein OO17_15565 [Rhodopseudomonas palustris]MDF3810411.1 hypothetical protein [Rhodopseudomonas sp. BAL398]WOK19609.1 hypothetical protein RBJ75_08860 [Rhodopseudomonas sp. BAL398]
MTIFLTLLLLPTTRSACGRLVLIAAGLRRLVNGRVAAAIVRHQRRAALRRWVSRGPQDITPHHGQVDSAAERAAWSWLRCLPKS